MNILYTGAFRFPIGDAASQRVLNNAKILRELGHEVTFLSFGGNTKDADKYEEGTYYYQGFKFFISHDIDVKVDNSFKRILNFFLAGKNALRIVNEILKDIDVIIAYNPSMYFTSKLLGICNKNRIYFVSDVTEWFDSNEFPGGRFAPPAWVNNLNMKQTQKKVKNKILISSYLNSFYGSSNNILLPPLVDSTDSKWTGLTYVLPDFNGVRIVYAGTPAKKDLLENILEGVYSCLTKGLNIQFVVVGVNSEEILHYNNYQKVLTFPENIIFCGRIKQTEVPSYYNVSDFSIIVRENTRKSMAGFPTKLVESMMAGRPVLLNYTSDIDKYVVHGQNGFVMPNWSSLELEKLLSQIVKLSRDDIEEMKSKALQCGLEKFNYQAYNNQMEVFMNNLKY